MPAETVRDKLGNNMASSSLQKIEPLDARLEKVVNFLDKVMGGRRLGYFLYGCATGFVSALVLVIFTINWSQL